MLSCCLWSISTHFNHPTLALMRSLKLQSIVTEKREILLCFNAETKNGSFHQVSQLKIDDTFISDPPAISEILAQHYISVSANSNYDDTFPSFKLQSKKSSIFSDPPPGEPLSYNLPITAHELSITINKNLKNASPDKIAFTLPCSKSSSKLSLLPSISL